MKQGTAYAARLKKAFNQARASASVPPIPDADDPLRRLAVAVLGVRIGDDASEKVINRLFSNMVDWNEIRVTQVSELHGLIGDSLPDGIAQTQQLHDALHAVYQRENRMTLNRLAKLGRREARQYLETLGSLDPYVVASVVLWSLGGHAIPVDDRLLRALREAELVHPDATRAEVQAFLERHIPASDAKEFCLVMRASPPGKRSRKEKSKPRAGRARPARKKARKGA